MHVLEREREREREENGVNYSSLIIKIVNATSCFVGRSNLLFRSFRLILSCDNGDQRGAVSHKEAKVSGIPCLVCFIWFFIFIFIFYSLDTDRQTYEFNFENVIVNTEHKNTYDPI